MSKRYLYLITVLISLTLFSCKNNSSKGSSQTTTPIEETLQKGKYAIKSGIVEYKVTMMNMEQKQTMTFDDYGEKQATLAQIEMMGMKINQCTIMKDGYLYNFDLDKKTGTKTSISPETNIDFHNLTTEIQEQMKIKKIGEETMIGKPCIKYSIDNEKLKMKGFYWVWNGIALKTNVDMGGIKMIMEAISVDEKANIPDSTFKIPADIKFN